MTTVAAPPTAAPQVLASRPARQKMGAQARREAIIFYVCVAPWIIGFILFTLGPMAVSLVISLTKWNFIQSPTWVGLGNYLTILTDDPDFRQALQVTSFYAVFSIPIRLGAALGLAILLNEATKGVSFFRTAFYLPTIVASVAAAVLWQFILNPVYGPVNGFLRVFGIEGPHWFTDPSWVPWGLIMMSAWGVGSSKSTTQSTAASPATTRARAVSAATGRPGPLASPRAERSVLTATRSASPSARAASRYST